MSRTGISPPQSPAPGPEIDVLRLKSIAEAPIPPPDEILYVDGFTGEYTDWNEVGTTPYLDATSDGNYIEATTSAAWQAWFSFENITLGGAEIKKVVLEGYTSGPYNEAVDYDIYTKDFTWLGSMYATGGSAWVTPRWIGKTVGEAYPAILTEEGFNNLEVMAYFYDPSAYGGAGNIIDALRLKVWYQEWPDVWTHRVNEMQDNNIDVLTDLVGTEDIDELSNECFTITENLGFQMGFIGYNIRDTATIQSYYRPAITYWPLHDVEFRHALTHCYDQLGIIAQIYGYTVTPIRSLVPPAQSRYYNSAVPTHPYNPGDPFSSPPGEHSTCGLLKDKGYTFVDDDSSGNVTDADYWRMPNGDPLPLIEILTPLMEVAPTSYQHGAEFIADLAEIGLAATTANGNHGLINLPSDFGLYLYDVYDLAEFDAYMVFYSLGRLPGQLYSLLHTSQDSLIYPGRENAVGVNDATIDTLTETVKFSLDVGAIETAAKTVQEMLYTPDKITYPNADNFAMAQMILYSRSYFNAFNPYLRGIIRSPGYGSDNKWTLLNINWESGHERIESSKTVVIWCLKDAPQSFNPCSAGTEFSWKIIEPTEDALTAVNPYNHNEVPWLAEDWTITDTGFGMDIDFVLNDTVEWQDGKPFTASDVEFCLEFLRDYEVPRYADTWQTLTDVVVTDATHLTIQADEAGIDLFYDYSSLAAMLPEHIWDRFGAPSPTENQAVLDYDPNEPYNTAAGYTPGPHPPPTNLFGTGPFVFQFWDSVNQYGDMWRNEYYFKSSSEIHSLKIEMFHEVGDVDENGVVDQIDEAIMLLAYGSIPGDPNWNPDCDLNGDLIIDVKDLAILGFYLGWYREYPGDVTDIAILAASTYPTAVPGQEVTISVTAKNKGLTSRTVNFTYYYDDTFIGYQVLTLAPCATNLSYTWDTTGVPAGTYTIKVNSTVVGDTDIDTSDNFYVNGQMQFITPTISVEPPLAIVGSAGKDFSISVNITDAPYNNTWAWEFKLSWNTSLLNITDINEGTFLSQNGAWTTVFANLTNQDEGWVLASCTLAENPIAQGQPLPHGNGSLAIVDFTVLDVGNCTLHLSDTILLDYDIDPYAHQTQDGEFAVILGDINRDGVVDEADKDIIVAAYGSTPGDPNWNPEADIWGPGDEPDGIINVYDLAMWGKEYEGPP